MQFENRQEAGKLLAEQLVHYDTGNSMVVAIPRGGVPVGYEVSQVLHMPLAVVITRKVGHPRQPEFAVCAVTESRHVLCDERIRAYLDEAWLKEAISKEHLEAQRRRNHYAPNQETASLVFGKDVFVVDDGVATGLTILAAVQELEHYQPKTVSVAVPVISQEAKSALVDEVDRVIALIVPEYFSAVGLFYRHFPPTTDDEVVRLLRLANMTQ